MYELVHKKDNSEFKKKKCDTHTHSPPFPIIFIYILTPGMDIAITETRGVTNTNNETERVVLIGFCVD